MESEVIKEIGHGPAKDGTPFFTRLSREGPFYSLQALTTAEQTEMGFLNFQINNKDRGRECWIYKIQVVEPFLCLGVGKTLLCDFERFLLDEKVGHIEAKFYPEGPGGSRARKFYEDNFYSIIDNHEIVKYLKPDNCVSVNYFTNKKKLDPASNQEEEALSFLKQESGNTETEFDNNTKIHPIDKKARHSHPSQNGQEM